MKRQNFGSNSALHCAHPLMYWICHGGSNYLSSEIKRSRADERRVGAAKSREMPRSNSADTSILIKMGCGHTSWLLLVLMRPPVLVHSQSARPPARQATNRLLMDANLLEFGSGVRPLSKLLSQRRQRERCIEMSDNEFRVSLPVILYTLRVIILGNGIPRMIDLVWICIPSIRYFFFVKWAVRDLDLINENGEFDILMQKLINYGGHYHQGSIFFDKICYDLIQ